MGTKNVYENGPDPFFCFFSILWEREWSRFVWPNPFERFVTRLYKRIWCPDSFAPAIQNCKRISHAAQLLLRLANNTARTQIHNYLCQEMRRLCIAKLEVHSFLLKRREGTLAARSEVLELLEVKDGRWLVRLDDDSPKVKWMRRVYPRVDYTPAAWTVAGTVDRCYAWAAELKHPHLKGDIYVSSAVPLSICLFVVSSP